MKNAKKGIYILLGTVSATLGTIGIFVPGIPTTPLYLLALWLLSKGSAKLHEKMLRYKVVRSYVSRRGTTKAVKIRLLLLMSAMVSFSAYLYWGQGTLSYWVIGFGVVGLIFMITKIKVVNKQ